jgi:hypothetical protein
MTGFKTIQKISSYEELIEKIMIKTRMTQKEIAAFLDVTTDALQTQTIESCQELRKQLIEWYLRIHFL